VVHIQFFSVQHASFFLLNLSFTKNRRDREVQKWLLYTSPVPHHGYNQDTLGRAEEIEAEMLFAA
jgi:hypothetical protein